MRVEENIKRIDRKNGPLVLSGKLYEGCAVSMAFGGVEIILIAPELGDLQQLFADNKWKPLNPNMAQCVTVGSSDRCSTP